MKKKILAFITDGKEFLALRNDSSDPSHGGDYWFVVTGAVEEESLEDAVRREVEEETTLEVKEILNLNWGSLYSYSNEDCQESNFMVFVNKGKVTLNEENIDFEWLHVDDFVKRISWNGNIDELKSILKLGLKKEIDNSLVRIDDFISDDVLKTYFIDGDNKTALIWNENNNFSKLFNVRQAYGMCFDKKGRVLIVSHKKNKWGLPGGKPEKGESYEETLKREVMEEANVEIVDLIPIGYNKIEQIKDGKKEIFFQLRYAASVKKILRQKVDPATNVIFKRRFIKPEHFLKYVLWGRPGGKMIEAAVEKYKSKSKNI